MISLAVNVVIKLNYTTLTTRIESDSNKRFVTETFHKNKYTLHFKTIPGDRDVIM